MNFLKKLFGKQSNLTPLPTENGITFLHKHPETFNLGDYLCTPRHYFSFTPAINNLVIAGGGALAEFGIKDLKKYNFKPSSAVLWGSGLSIQVHKNQSAFAKNLPYLAWGIRDIDRTDDAHFLPCVSCLHPMLDQAAAETGTLLFLNADPRVTSQQQIQEYQDLAKQNDWNLVFNSCSEEEMASALQTSKHIITNSFHAGYWGLLTGHKVSLVGYSSKFISLLKAFGFDGSQLIPIARGDGKGLIGALEPITDDRFAVELEKPEVYLNDFRQRNLDFAKQLETKGVIKQAVLKHG